jgi:hypothetical protein
MSYGLCVYGMRNNSSTSLDLLHMDEQHAVG